MTATQTLDQADIADIQSAVDALNQAMVLLAQAGLAPPQVAYMTRDARDSTEGALIIANNVLKLAQRDASTNAA